MLAYLAVAVGGLIGTGLRLACDLAFPHGDGDFPIEGDAGSSNGDGKAQITGGATQPPPAG